ncbi:MAG: type IIA DNA topoisomerase subunit B, partial [Bacteroidetes bacterium]|nr:type IIA DNA topoisomerase subunit B [Bacteroidota bacterium]
MAEQVNYTEDNIKSLNGMSTFRLRPGMYIGKLGDGSASDDGIYVLLKEIMDNSIDEFVMGNGKTVEITIKDRMVTVRDFGRGIPLGKVIDCVSKINTGGKYDSRAFKKSVGLNGVGTKAVNALSSYFRVESVRDGENKAAEFAKGVITKDFKVGKSLEKNGTMMSFIPDDTIFQHFQFRSQHIERLLWNYCYLNAGLTIVFNGQKFKSENGLKDLLAANMSEDPLYTPIHLRGDDIEVAITHTNSYGEEYYSFVNGQYTTQGGTHQAAFREAYVKVIRDFFKKDYEAVDIRSGIVAAVAVKVIEPVFESQTKTKLGSNEIEPNGKSIKTFILDFLAKELDNFLHRNPDLAQNL